MSLRKLQSWWLDIPSNPFDVGLISKFGTTKQLKHIICVATVHWIFFNICQRSLGWGCPNMAYTTKLRWYPGFRHTQMRERSDYIKKSGVWAKCWPIVAVLENTLSNPVTASPQKFMAFFPFLRKSMKTITWQTQTLCSP
jgi:hypothetical protein